jgi:capsular polysaccharide biosynthesis protein
MKILFVCKGDLRRFFPSVAAALREQYGFAVSAVAFATPATRALVRPGVFDEVHNLAAHLKQWTRQYDVDECAGSLAEADFCEPECLNSMILSDRIVSRYRFDRVVKIVAGIHDFWRTVMDTVQPDAVLGEIASVSEWIGWSLAKRRNISYLTPYPTPVAERFFFIDSPAGAWDAMERAYAELRDRELSADESQQAAQFLHQFRTQRLKPPSLARGLRSPFHLDPTRWIQRLKRVPFRVTTYFEDGDLEVGSFHGTPPWQSIWADIVKVLQHVVAESTGFEHQAVKGKTAYFALHSQPEFTTDVRAPFFTNQVALAENIARSLPVGYRLVVKEHPGMKGERAPGYYRQLKRLYNVRLLSPSVDSHELILNSDVVLAITGTTAWEGILYEKPVIAFGPLGYRFFDLLYECGNVTELPWLIREALQGFRPDRRRLLKLVWSLLKSAHRGEWGDSLADSRILDRSNVDRIAQAVVAELSSRVSTTAASSISV